MAGTLLHRGAGDAILAAKDGRKMAGWAHVATPILLAGTVIATVITEVMSTVSG